MNNWTKKLLFGTYLIVVISLFLYSFTQIDLGLTVIRNHSLHFIENAFQYIGYFERPLSTLLYITIISLLFIFYGIFLYLAYKKYLTRKYVWTVIITISVILAFSYNAFSYDLFNYIFDAKIVTYYHQNPYLHKALDYLGDPMLGFMHWTHRTYPYGPFWLGLTIPLSFLGFHVFLITFFLFKFLIGGSYLGTVYFIEKILQTIKKRDSSLTARNDGKKTAASFVPSNDEDVFALILFALNPLVIIECLVSSHNDIVMLFFSMWALYLLLIKRHLWAFVLLIMSIAIKFATVMLLPVFIYLWYFRNKEKKVLWKQVVWTIEGLMLLAFIAVTLRTNFQPWYLLYLVPFAALLAKKYYVFIPIIILSLFALCIYIPFLYTGNWDPPIPMILLWTEIAGVVLSGIVVGIYYLRRAQQSKVKSVS